MTIKVFVEVDTLAERDYIRSLLDTPAERERLLEAFAELMRRATTGDADLVYPMEFDREESRP